MQMIGTPISGFYSLVTVDMMVDCMIQSPSTEFGGGGWRVERSRPLSLLCSHLLLPSKSFRERW